MRKIIPEELVSRYGFFPGHVSGEDGAEYFLKKGPPSGAYRCEANGLRELARSGAVRVAEVVSAGDDYILTGYVADGVRDGNFFGRFGRQLARLYRYTGDSFGFYEDNFIGANPQANIPSGTEGADWAAFYWNKRLLFQYRLAERNGYGGPSLARGFAALERRYAGLLAGSEEPPTLLHGDLWSGNFLCGPGGEAVLIDPAVYYGHREADLAMTRMFGGFSPDFYRAYWQEYPLPEGWQKREGVYLLYHVLNHLNLFGPTYLRQVEALLESV